MLQNFGERVWGLPTFLQSLCADKVNNVCSHDDFTHLISVTGVQVALLPFHSLLFPVVQERDAGCSVEVFKLYD